VSRRPVQDVRFWSIQDRSSHERTAKPHLVRWVVDGQRFSLSFETRSQADWYRSRLVTAYKDGEAFDARTGEPASWQPALDELPVFEWARQWIRQEWPDWAPRSRKAAVESLARFVPLVHDVKAPPAPEGLRAYLTRTLNPASEVDDACDLEKWLRRWGLSLGELNREVLAEVVHKLGIGDKGQPLAAGAPSSWAASTRTRGHRRREAAAGGRRIATPRWSTCIGCRIPRAWQR
jgi:hypothetical protein